MPQSGSGGSSAFPGQLMASLFWRPPRIFTAGPEERPAASTHGSVRWIQVHYGGCRYRVQRLALRAAAGIMAPMFFRGCPKAEREVNVLLTSSFLHQHQFRVKFSRRSLTQQRGSKCAEGGVFRRCNLPCTTSSWPDLILTSTAPQPRCKPAWAREGT